MEAPSRETIKSNVRNIIENKLIDPVVATEVARLAYGRPTTNSETVYVGSVLREIGVPFRATKDVPTAFDDTDEESQWKKEENLNDFSIGIELENRGHDYGYQEFTSRQYNSLKKLINFLISIYRVKSKNIIYHSDISPNRKKDPGEKFPWEYFSKNEVGYWHNINPRYLVKKRNIKTDKEGKIKFINNLYKIGYSKNFKILKTRYTKILTIAFQRRFRQNLINGIIDQECLIISENLSKKFNKTS